MAASTQPGLVDLEKELTCSVSPISAYVASYGLSRIIVTMRTFIELIQFLRSAPRFSISPSLCSTASTHFADLVSKNGSRGKSLRPRIQNQIPLLAHHAVLRSEIPGRTLVSLPSSTCTCRPILARAKKIKKRAKHVKAILREKMYCRKSREGRNVTMKQRTDG